MTALIGLKSVLFAVLLFCGCTMSGFSQSSAEEELFNAGMDSRSADFILKQALKIDSFGASTGNVLTKIRATMLRGNFHLISLSIDAADYSLMNCEKMFCDNPALKQSVDYSKMLLLRSIVYFQMGEPDASIPYRMKALKVAREIKSADQEMAVLRSISVLERNSNHPEEALFYFLEYFSLKNKQKKSAKDNGSDYFLLANIYSSINQYSNAKTYVAKALAIQLKNRNEEHLSLTYNTLGDIYRGLQRYDSALIYFEKAKALAVRNKQRLVEINADNNVAITYFDKGDYQRTVSLTNNLLKQEADLPLIALLSPMQYRAASYYQLGNHKKALAAAQEVYNAAVDVEARQSIIDAADLLAKIYHDLKKYDSSTYFLQTKISLKDSLMNFNTQDKFSTVHAQLHSLEKQHEIESLEREKLVQRSQNRLLMLALVFGATTACLASVVIFLKQENNKKKQKLLSYELQTELEKSRSDLNQQAVRMIHINNGLNDVFNTLKKDKTQTAGRNDVKSMLNSIQVNQSLDKEWENFDKYFGNVHREFLGRMTDSFPTLTIMEKRLAALVKMNLTNKEIATILNIEPKSVTVAKYRLKKRLGLSSSDDVYEYLVNLSRGLDQSKIMAG